MTQKSIRDTTNDGQGTVVPVLSATLDDGTVVPVLHGDLPKAGAAPVLDPGSDHATVFEFAGDKRHYKSYAKARRTDSKSPAGAENAGSPKTDKKSGTSSNTSGEDWNMSLPGFADPGTTVLHSLVTMDQLEGILPHLIATARGAALPNFKLPRLVLSVRHEGPLDSARIARIGDNLNEAGIAASIVVIHDALGD